MGGEGVSNYLDYLRRMWRRPAAGDVEILLREYHARSLLASRRYAGQDLAEYRSSLVSACRGHLEREAGVNRTRAEEAAAWITRASIELEFFIERINGTGQWWQCATTAPANSSAAIPQADEHSVNGGRSLDMHMQHEWRRAIARREGLNGTH